MADNIQYYGTGRRKSSTARVFLRPGSGRFTVNDRALDEYFARESLCMIIRQPLDKAEVDRTKFDFKVTVRGGGTAGQAGAVRLGVARALLKYDKGLRRPLKEGGFLTRDARIVERKKVGLHKARKDTQYSKR